MTVPPINLAKLRESAISAETGYGITEIPLDLVLALIDIAEAAHQVMNELLWGDTRTSDAYETLGQVLARFDFDDRELTINDGLGP